MHVDYWLSLLSPWTYLGHQRFVQIAQRAGASVAVRPVDYARIFPASGGVPLPKRAPQRQAYRLVELQRWSAHLGLPLNLQPRHYPVPADAANRLLIAVDQADGTDAALGFAGRVLRACWAEERDISNLDTLAALLAEAGLPAGRIAGATAPALQGVYDAYTGHAIEAGVFGAPTYGIDGELFWGQDRLDFVARKLGTQAT